MVLKKVTRDLGVHEVEVVLKVVLLLHVHNGVMPQKPARTPIREVNMVADILEIISFWGSL